MKKSMFVIAVLLAVMLMAASAFALTVKSNVNNFIAGNASTDKEEVTCEVYNATDETLTSGDVLVYYIAGTDDGRSVTKCNGLGQIVVGVANESIAAGTWGQMLVYGYHSAVKFYGASAGYDVTAGYGLYPYGTGNGSNEASTTTNGKSGCGYLVGSATNKKAFGVALDAATGGTSTTVEAFINCL
jgi:hypothetical protein